MTDENLPIKDDAPTIDEVTAVVLSYTDPNLMVLALENLGWSCTQEIIETLKVARQGVNLGAKMTAIKYLRTLLLASAEASGIIGNVTRSVPGQDGSVTTFSAKHISTALNPKRKQINSEELKNAEQKSEETNEGGSPGDENERERNDNIQPNDTEKTNCGGRTGTDRGRDSSPSPVGGSVGTGDSKSGASAGGVPIGEIFGDDSDAAGDSDYEQPPREGETNHPCIEHRPPSRDRKLYPGVSGIPPEKKE